MSQDDIRVFLCAGESSGDLHGSRLVRALHEAEARVSCYGLGGRRMADAGMQLTYDLASQGIMGFAEVVKRFGMVHKLFMETARGFDEDRPDCVVLIDYPGFNIQLAKRAALTGIPVVYYISPQVWAWKKGRVHTLAEYVDKMLVILPFEEELYHEVGLDCTYVGHPLADHLAETEINGEFRGGLVIGLMPGSREQEIRRIFGTMLEVAEGIREHHPEARFVAACVDEERESQVREMAGDFPLETAVGRSHEVLDAARFCLVASGTATLEAALMGVPMIIVYRVNWFSYILARWLVRIKYIGLVNILAKKSIVPEYIQGAARPDAILPRALALIEEGPERARMLNDLASLREKVGGPGASRRAAGEVLAVIGRGAHG